jgi:hypothetical protein
MELLKTTIEIPDALFRRAKSAAAERGVPLRALVSEALADKLARLSQSRGGLTSFEPPAPGKPSGCNAEIPKTAE